MTGGDAQTGIGSKLTMEPNQWTDQETFGLCTDTLSRISPSVLAPLCPL